REDIPLLADHFLSKYAEQMQKSVIGISRTARELLLGHDWAGHIRELENVIERAVALETPPSILPESLPPSLRGAPTGSAVSATDSLPVSGFDLESHIR